MKKLFLTAAIVAASLSANAVWNSSTSSGSWTDSSIWNQGAVPDDTFDGINIGANTTVSINSAVTPIKSMFIKPNASLVFKTGASLTTTGIAFDGAGSNMKFLGGSVSTTGQINQNNYGDYYFGGIDDESGEFAAAAAKSINSTNRLQMKSGTIAAYYLGASNLVAEKAAGLDGNALFYTTGELQMMQNEFLLDFSNITVESLAASGIANSGTYYVALASWGITFKTIGGSDFNPTLASAPVDTDIVSFEGFEWANTTTGNNTLYAVLSVNVPEPATYAAIFGALALAFVAYRRRK